MEEKWIRKYMRIARLVGEDQNPCYSRHIGAIVVNPDENRIVGTGYNGPPRKTAHCDSREYLDEIVWPLLTIEECKDLKCETKDQFLDKYTDCKVCPRRLVGAASGTRLELCSCVHSEVNAILNATESLRGCWLFCWCGVPCSGCVKLIINKQINTVVCLNHYVQGLPTLGGGNDYDRSARIFLKWAKINLIERDPEELLKE